MKQRTEELTIQIRMALGGQKETGGITNTDAGKAIDLEARPLMQRDEDGEYADTKQLNNKQILKKQKDMLKDQDKHLDEIGGIVKNIKYDGENMGQELKYQNNMLGKLGTDMDRTHNKMVKVDNKLKELIAKSN